MPSETGKSMKTLAGCLVVVSALALVGCKQEPAAGVYVEISLKNDTDIDKYVDSLSDRRGPRDLA